MKKLILTTGLALIWLLSFSQTETLKKSNKEFSAPGNDFAFIEPNTDTTQLEFVATVRSIAKKGSGISKAYFASLEQANKYGANCFKLNSYNKNDSGEVILTPGKNIIRRFRLWKMNILRDSNLNRLKDSYLKIKLKFVNDNSNQRILINDVTTIYEPLGINK